MSVRSSASPTSVPADMTVDRPLLMSSARTRPNTFVSRMALAMTSRLPSGVRVGHHVDRVALGEVRLHGVLHLVGGLGPDLDQLLPTLLVGDDAPAVLLLDLLGALLVGVEDLLLLLGRLDVVDADGDPGPG